MSPLPAALSAVALLLANAFFVGAEFALLASRRSRLEHLADGGDGRARHALAGMDQLSLMLAGAQLGITMASLGLGAVAEPAIAHVLESAFEALGLPDGLLHPLAFAIALSIVVLLHMVIGEMAPKSWAIADPERAALVLARPFRAFALLTKPVIWLLNAAANLLVRLVGVTPQDERAQAHSAADLGLLLTESLRGGSLAERDVAVFSRALTLSGLQADAAMTARPDIISVPAAADVATIEQAALGSGFSKLLVVGDSLDDVMGVVHVRDVLGLDTRRRASATAGALARPVLVAYENQPIEDLLLDMRSHHRRVAVVVDDLGSVCGMVTLQGVLGTLVGRDGAA